MNYEFEQNKNQFLFLLTEGYTITNSLLDIWLLLIINRNGIVRETIERLSRMKDWKMKREIIIIIARFHCVNHHISVSISISMLVISFAIDIVVLVI